MRAFEVVTAFEKRVAEYAWAEHAVAVQDCTIALFLCCKFKKVKDVHIPAKTYLSVPMAIRDAGGTPVFEDREWKGIYELAPYKIWDGAKRFKKGMYAGGLHCLSFHAKKHINIGRGGMILTDDANAADWLRKARYTGRAGKPYPQEVIETHGWNCYMTPEQAARGLELLDNYQEQPDQEEDYPDLRLQPVFNVMHHPV